MPQIVVLGQPGSHRPGALRLGLHTNIPQPPKGIGLEYQRSSPASALPYLLTELLTEVLRPNPGQLYTGTARLPPLAANSP